MRWNYSGLMFVVSPMLLLYVLYCSNTTDVSPRPTHMAFPMRTITAPSINFYYLSCRWSLYLARPRGCIAPPHRLDRFTAYSRSDFDSSETGSRASGLIRWPVTLDFLGLSDSLRLRISILTTYLCLEGLLTTCLLRRFLLLREHFPSRQRTSVRIARILLPDIH